MIAITYIGQATTLIEINGQNILTDPVFSNKVLFVKRHEELKFNPADIPELAAVVISHAHHDHLDINSFKYIKSTVPVFVPAGFGKFLSKFIRNPVIEMNEWASHNLPDGMKIIAAPAKHVGFRWSGLRFRKCCSYILAKESSSVYFAGDTEFGEHFKEIGNLCSNPNPIDVALLPIGGYSPKWLKRYHMNPIAAIDAFICLRAKHMIPIHFGTFRFSTEKMSEPVEWLKRLADERNLSDRVHILNSGDRWEL
ncbi:MAG: MBL fold metallo-hydrolase [Deltaproteobacteria bacterium]|nr:MBL fold metallo-hydrolase [Deltaproteobacteria bacterium]MBI2341372.1 MBL fold metallo-hydrolase [Deltaproteobacteria bacterium]